MSPLFGQSPVHHGSAFRRAQHAFVLVPAQVYIRQHLATNQEFPPRQEADSFSLDQVLKKLQQNGATRKMKPSPKLIAAALAGLALITGCASQERRTDRVEHRQDDIDRRTEGRLERRQIRSDREDARTEARMNSW